jgi:hypothetical protein
MTSEVSQSLSDKHVREVRALCDIARENGALISIKELIALVPLEATEDQLEEAFGSDPRLSGRFFVESGYVLERLGGEDESSSRITVEEEREERARANLETARRFGRFLVKGALLVSVGGGNSYLKARENEDIDFFCVARTGRLWPLMLKGLLLARIFRLANRGVPELCFSFEMDRRWAEEAFKKAREPIFARDALTLKVIEGNETYHSLLDSARWMREIFPGFYTMRLLETRTEASASPERASTLASVLNSFLYLTLGRFLRAKSWALNRQFAKRGMRSSIFAVGASKSHYIFESNRYRNLIRMYDEIVEG